MKKKFAALIAAIVVFTMSACSAENTVSDDTTANAENSATEMHEETTAGEKETTASESESIADQDQNQEEEDNVYEMAKIIHTAASTYLTMKGIDGEEIPEDFDFNEMKYIFQEEGYLSKITCDLSEIDVKGEIKPDIYVVTSVTVTYTGITVTYPDRDREIEEKKNSEIAKFIEEKLAEHNWSAGMSEAEFKAATPDVTYAMDADKSIVTETFTMKTIESDSTFDFDGHKAYISADFTDDSLMSIGYKIEFNEGSRVDTPAHDYYTELTFDFYDKFGNPTSQEDEPDSLLSKYSTSWHDAGGSISLLCLEREPSLVIEYSGTVYVTLYFL